MVKVAKKRCSICATAEPMPGRSSCAECAKTTRQIVAARRAAKLPYQPLRPVCEVDHRHQQDPPEPCVLYGLLTAADVAELERRRRMWSLRRLVERVVA